MHIISLWLIKFKSFEANKWLSRANSLGKTSVDLYPSNLKKAAEEDILDIFESNLETIKENNSKCVAYESNQLIILVFIYFETFVTFKPSMK